MVEKEDEVFPIGEVIFQGWAVVRRVKMWSWLGGEKDHYDWRDHKVYNYHSVLGQVILMIAKNILTTDWEY